jgi:hypothetical protein
MLCVSVVEVALTGVCILVSSVVVVVLCVDGLSSTVVHPESDTKAAPAKQQMMSLFIMRFLV